MKRLVKLTLVAALLVCCSSNVSAQKFGYINPMEVISAMPETDSARVKLEAFAKELDAQLETIQVEFNNKLNEFQKNEKTYSESIRNLKQKELTDLQTRFGEINEMAQREMQKKQEELMKPVEAKATEAIKKVAKAQGLAGVMNAGVLLYQNEAAMVNLLPLVKKELGITK